MYMNEYNPFTNYYTEYLLSSVAVIVIVEPLVFLLCLFFWVCKIFDGLSGRLFHVCGSSISSGAWIEMGEHSEKTSGRLICKAKVKNVEYCMHYYEPKDLNGFKNFYAHLSNTNSHSKDYIIIYLFHYL